MPIFLQPPAITLSILASAIYVHWQFSPWPPIWHAPLSGLPLIVLGVAFTVWARLQFMARKTTLFVGRSPSQLVCDGPFRCSRNPMYVGVIAAFVGVALCFGSLPLLLAPPLAFLALNFFYIPREEAMLRSRFSDQYLAYSQRVRRWL